LTQLTLGIDRDGNEKIKGIANENDESVKELIAEVVKKCKEKDLVKVLRSLKPNMKFYGEVLTTLRSVPKLND